MAPGTTRQSKAATGKVDHEISEEDSSGDEGGKKSFSFSDKQMETVSLLVKTAVSAAVAQVLPLTQRLNSHDSSGGASSGASAQDGFNVNNSSSNSDDRHGSNAGNNEEGEVYDEELDEYEKSLIALLGDNKITGPEISEKIGRLLERCLGSPLDDKAVKLKRDSFPRPENIQNLKVPRTNPEVFTKASVDHQNLDRGLQLTQSFMVGGIIAVARQAEKLLSLRNWAASLETEEKECLPEQVKQLTSMYVDLMDSLILFVKSMGDLTSIRRRMFKNDLVEPYRSLMEEDKNPPSADWLGGDDIHGAIRKAKANATLTEDIAKRGKWPRKSFNRNSRGFGRPYDRKKGQTRDESNDNKQGYNRQHQHQNQRRKSENYRPQNERRQQDFRRRDSR